MEPVRRLSVAKSAFTPERSSRVPSRPICRCSSRRSSSGRQSQDRQGARPDGPAIDPRPRRRGHRMRRRELMLLAACTAMTRNSASAAVEMARIGFVQTGSWQENQSLLDAFRDHLSALGWTDGRNIAILDRWAEERTERLPGIVKELIGSGVAVLVTAGTPATLAATRANATVS